MIIGLTGGIASGKSTAARLLGEWGAHVIDADILGHRAYLKDTTAYFQVIETFGADCVGADGEIDRKVLGSKVFGEGNRLDELTAIVWPAIRHLAEEEIRSIKADQPQRVVILEAAVLLEAGWQDLVDRIWVTIVDRDTAIARASARDGVDAAAVEDRINAQLSNDERSAAAHETIDNSRDEDHLVEQLQRLWKQVSPS